MNNTSLKRQPTTGSPARGRSRGEWVHTSSAALWRARDRSAMAAASKSARDGVDGISSSDHSSPTGDRLGGAGRRPTPPGLVGRDSARPLSAGRTEGVERAGSSGSVPGASPNFAPHLEHTGPSIHNPGLWLLQK
jgi:hypothetical protein